MHPCFHMTPPWPPFGLDRFLSLVQVHLRSNVVRVCSSFWSFVMANFPSCSHHAIGKEVRPPKNFSSVGIHRSGFEFGALGLFWSYLPHPNLELHTIFYIDSLFFKEHSFKISNIFSTSSTGSQSFSLGRIHWSRFEFIALGLVLIISPSSELRIAHHFFYGLIILQGTFCQIFKNFLNRLDQLASDSTGSSS